VTEDLGLPQPITVRSTAKPYCMVGDYVALVDRRCGAEVTKIGKNCDGWYMILTPVDGGTVVLDD